MKKRYLILFLLFIPAMILGYYHHQSLYLERNTTTIIAPLKEISQEKYIWAYANDRKLPISEATNMVNQLMGKEKENYHIYQIEQEVNFLEQLSLPVVATIQLIIDAEKNIVDDSMIVSLNDQSELFRFELLSTTSNAPSHEISIQGSYFIPRSYSHYFGKDHLKSEGFTLNSFDNYHLVCSTTIQINLYSKEQ